MRSHALLLLPLLALLAPGAAGACTMTPARHPPTAAQERAWARQLIDGAAAIVDGEVIRPYVRGGAPALVRVHRRFKGPEGAEIAVGVVTSCDVPLVRTGERIRMLLSGGPDFYVIHMGSGAAGAVDRLLGSDRRRDWPYVEGTIVQP